MIKQVYLQKQMEHWIKDGGTRDKNATFPFIIYGSHESPDASLPSLLCVAEGSDDTAFTLELLNTFVQVIEVKYKL